MSLQAKFTAIAVNLKRIANLIRENNRESPRIRLCLFAKLLFFI